MPSREKKPSGSRAGKTSTGSPKRPARTIDLEAEEIEIEPGAGEDGDSASDESESVAGSGAETETSDEDDRASRLAGQEKDEAKETAAQFLPPQRTTPSQLKAFVTHLAAGLVGGLVGVIGAGIGFKELSVHRLFGNDAATETGVQIEERLDELTSRVQGQDKALATLPKADVVAGIEKRVSALESKPASGSEIPDQVLNRISKLEEALKAMQTAGSSGSEGAAALVARVDALQQALETRSAALTKDIADVRSAVASGAGASQDADAEVLKALNTRIVGLEKQLDGLAAAKAGGAQTGSGRAAAAALAFESLRRAAQNGRPFETQLGSLAAAVGPEIDLAGLSGVAATGVKSQGELLHELVPVLNAARAAVIRADDKTFLDRLASNAQAVVRVRRVGPQEGPGAMAVLSRMEAAGRAGDLGSAIKEAHGLSGAAGEVFAPWLEAADRRHALDASLKSLEARLLENLINSGQAQR